MYWHSIIQHISQVTGRPFTLNQHSAVSGGSINSAAVLQGDDGVCYFVKTNRTGRAVMFAAEAKGLAELAGSACIRVPRAVCFGDDGDRSYIVLEYLDMKSSADQALLGEQLAAMHRHTAEHFGWEIDNTIGATFQPNTKSDDWLTFWREQRLGFQLQLAAENGYGGELQRLGEAVLSGMASLFTGHEPEPSVLHGDLWGGNVAGLSDGTPVIFDPALYYGDRETDIAMTSVFGGFAPDFYAAYENAWPLDEGFAVRKTLYNSYHIINHLNMFGGGYHGQAISMLEQVRAEIN